MDDCGAITTGGGRIYVQVKKDLGLGTSDTSPLGVAIDQAARQFHAGVEDEGGRRLREHHDLLAIISDRGAIRSVTQHLREIVAALSSLPDERPLDAVVTSQARQPVFEALLRPVNRSLAAAYSVIEIDEPTLRAFFRVLYVGVLELDSGQADRRAAENVLVQVLADPERRYGAFDELATDALKQHASRRWARASDLRAFVRSRGLELLDDPRYAADIERLRAATTGLLESQRAELVIEAPDGTVRVEREVSAHLDDASGAIALTGDAGTGKSAVAVNLAVRLREQGEDVVFLTADSFRPDIAAIRGLNFSHPLPEVFEYWDGDEQATLVIDGLDATRGTSVDGWVLELLPKLAGSRWRTIATLRTYDIRNVLKWRKVFGGAAIDESAAVQGLGDVHHLLVGDLSTTEIDQVRSQSAALGDLFDHADKRLRTLLDNPFNLSLAAALLRTSSSELGAVRSRLDLLDAYWRSRVRQAPDGLKRSGTLRTFTERLVEGRRTAVDILEAVEQSQLDEVEALLSDGVLRELRAAYSDTRIVEFAHPLLFDYAVATTIFFSDTPRFADRLDADPNLVIRLWPSVELYLSALWQQSVEHEPFWDLALHLATRPGGHPLVGIATAFVTLRSLSNVEDFAPLLAALWDSRTAEGLTCLNHISGSLTSGEISLAERRAAVPTLSDLVEAVAEIARSRDDLAIADGGRMLLRRLQEISPLEPASLGALARARAADSLTRFALASPAAPQRVDIARMVSEMVAAGVLIDPARCAPTLKATLDPAVLTEWGALAMRSAMPWVARIAGSLPELAGGLFATPWTFQETRKQGIGFGSVALGGLVTSWEGILDTARSDTSNHFPAFLDAAPAVAVATLVKVLALHPSDRMYPELSWSATPTPQDKPLTHMTKHAGKWLASVAEDAGRYEPVLDAFIAADTPSDHRLWQVVFAAGADHAATLGRAIFVRIPADAFNPVSVTLTPFVAAMSNELTGPDHESLERLILDVSAPEPENEEWRQLLIKRLVANLNPDHVQLDDVRRLLPDPPAEMSAAAPPQYGWTDGATPWNEEPDPAWPDITTVLTDTQVASNSSESDTSRAEARVRVRDAFLDAFNAHASDPAALGLLTDAARLLAMSDDVAPGSEVGNAVLQTFLRVLGSAS